jgi:hypothetical protein
MTAVLLAEVGPAERKGRFRKRKDSMGIARSFCKSSVNIWLIYFTFQKPILLGEQVTVRRSM